MQQRLNLRSVDRSKSRFAAYVEELVSVIGHADRAGPLRDYCLGLIMPCERKCVEPMAAVTAPDRTAAAIDNRKHPRTGLITLAKTKLIESGISRFDVNQAASLRD
jgi:hypothetical protein